MNDVRLIAIDYQQRRLAFFKAQLKSAHRKLDYSMKHNPDCEDHAEKGEVVSFYEWAVKMTEESRAKKTSDEKQATSGWISVEERLPTGWVMVDPDTNYRELEVYIVFVKGAMYPTVAQFVDGKFVPPCTECNAHEGRTGFADKITHWMPLPEPPEVEG